MAAIEIRAKSYTGTRTVPTPTHVCECSLSLCRLSLLPSMGW